MVAWTLLVWMHFDNGMMLVTVPTGAGICEQQRAEMLAAPKVLSATCAPNPIPVVQYIADSCLPLNDGSMFVCDGLPRWAKK
jgi:hypothetical protein